MNEIEYYQSLKRVEDLNKLRLQGRIDIKWKLYSEQEDSCEFKFINKKGIVKGMLNYSIKTKVYYIK